ncbi:MAG: DMT family transporter [Thermomicrobiales bacterium]|nr:DMT family transporter [Thermomicrobiales bacterium]
MNRSSTDSNLLAYTALAVSMAFVGTSMTANKFIVGNVPVMLAGFIRFLAATVFMVAITMVIDGRLPRLGRQTKLILAAQTFFGSFLFTILTLYGVDMTTAMVSGIVLAATPAMVAIMSWILGDRLARTAWIGVLITIGGVLVVNVLDASSGDQARRPILGAVLIFLAVICEALYTMFGRLIAESGSALGITSWYSIYGALMFLLPALWNLRDFSISTIPQSAWLAMIYMGAVPGATSVLLWYYGLRSVPPSIAGAFTGVMPITAVLSASLILDESIGWSHIIGMALIVFGIVLVARSRGREVTDRIESLDR